MKLECLFNLLKERPGKEIGLPLINFNVVRYGRIADIYNPLEALKEDAEREKFLPPALLLLTLQTLLGGDVKETRSLIKDFFINPETGKISEEGYRSKKRPKALPDVLKSLRKWMIFDPKRKKDIGDRDLVNLLIGTSTDEFDHLFFKDRLIALSSLLFLDGILGYGATRIIPNDFDIGPALNALGTASGVFLGALLGSASSRLFGNISDRDREKDDGKKSDNSKLITGLVGGVGGGLVGNALTPDEVMFHLGNIPELGLVGVGLLALNYVLGRAFPILQLSGEKVADLRDDVKDMFKELGDSVTYLFPSLIDLGDRRWLFRNESLRKSLIVEKIISRIDLGREILSLNFADESDIPDDLKTKIREEKRFSDVLFDIALIGALRKIPKNDLIIPSKMTFSNFFLERGKARLGVLKALSGTRPDIALAVALPATVRSYWELGLRGIDGLSNFYPRAYYDAKFYGERGDNFGNTGELMPLQNIWFRELQNELQVSSYLYWVYHQNLAANRGFRDLKNPVTEVVNSPLLEEALSVLALFSLDLNVREKDSGSVKHSLRAAVNEFLKQKDGPLNFAMVISAINFYIRAGKFFIDLYPEQKEIIEKAIGNLKTFRREIIKHVILDELKNPFETITNGEDFERMKRFSFIFYWACKESVEDLEDVELTNIITGAIRDIYRTSGQMGEKRKKPSDLLWLINTIIKITQNKEIKNAFIDLLSDMCKDVLENDLNLSDSADPNRFGNGELKANFLYFLENGLNILASTDRWPEKQNNNNQLEPVFFGLILNLLRSYQKSLPSYARLNITKAKQPKRVFVESVLTSLTSILEKSLFSEEHKREMGELITSIFNTLIECDARDSSAGATVFIS